jgi:hypothetical protein
MFIGKWVNGSLYEQKMMPFGGQANWAKMTSPRWRLSNPIINLTKKVNKTE